MWTPFFSFLGTCVHVEASLRVIHLIRGLSPNKARIGSWRLHSPHTEDSLYLYELVRPRGSCCICELFPNANLRLSDRKFIWSSLRVQPNDSKRVNFFVFQRWAYIAGSRKIRPTFSPKSKEKNEKQNLTPFEAVHKSDANHVLKKK